MAEPRVGQVWEDTAARRGVDRYGLSPLTARAEVIRVGVTRIVTVARDRLRVRENRAAVVMVNLASGRQTRVTVTELRAHWQLLKEDADG